MRRINDTFIEWLETYTNLSPSSIEKYSKAITKITLELENYDLPQIEIHNPSDTSWLEKILNHPRFQEKNLKGNRLYSTALKHFKRYLEDKITQDFKAELFKDKLEYEKNIIGNIINNNTSNTIIDREREKPPYRLLSNHKLWRRNSTYASDSIAQANYQCEFNNSHEDFISKYTQQNYVETHHLIPMKHQGDFEYSLDVHANIVSLCMVCHKKLYYGMFEDIKEILDKLFGDRQDRLVKSNIVIDLNDLYKCYN